MEDAAAAAHDAQQAAATLERQLRLYREHLVLLRSEERKLMLPGDPLLALYMAAGEKPDPVRAKLLEWATAFQQQQGDDSAQDYSREIGTAEIFKMPLRRGQGGAVTAWQICAKLRCRGDRDLLCSAIGRCAARRSDATWRQVRAQASLTPYQREARNFIYLSFAEDPRPGGAGNTDCSGAIPWPATGPKWAAGRRVELHADTAAILTDGCATVRVELDLPPDVVRERVEAARQLVPQAPQVPQGPGGSGAARTRAAPSVLNPAHLAAGPSTSRGQGAPAQTDLRDTRMRGGL